jgi:hemerythrin
MAGPDWKALAAERRRDELAARKAEQERKRDPELEEAFVAWAAYRVNGGDMKFEQWRREWLTTTQEAKDGR